MTAPDNNDAALPERVVVDANGAYWRDFGDYYSMCPTSTDNGPVELAALYVRSGVESGNARANRIAADFAEIPFENHDARILALAYLQLEEVARSLGWQLDAAQDELRDLLAAAVTAPDNNDAAKQIALFVVGLVSFGLYFILALRDVPLPYILPLLVVVIVTQWRLLAR